MQHFQPPRHCLSLLLTRQTCAYVQLSLYDRRVMCCFLEGVSYGAPSPSNRAAGVAHKRGLGIASPSGASRDWHTCAFRRSTNRLQPFGGGSSTFASSPTSTSSSPPPASCSSSGAAADRPSALSPTPPQSAPPQKSIGFPRFRSKSKFLSLIRCIAIFAHHRNPECLVPLFDYEWFAYGCFVGRQLHSAFFTVLFRYVR